MSIQVSRLLLTLCSQKGYTETSTYLPFQEIRPQGPARTISVVAQSALQTTGSDLIMLNCLWFYHYRCAGATQRVSYSTHMVQYITQLYICLCILCPLLYRVSPLYNLAIQSSACQRSLIVYHPVAPNTLYHFIPMYALIVNA